MKKALLSLALAVLSANVAFAQLKAKPIPVVNHGTYYITEAYLANDDCEFVSEEGAQMGEVPDTGPVSDNRCWTGVDVEGADTQSFEDNIKAVPGILCIGSRDEVFDVNDFVTGEDPFVQSFRLIKSVPLSEKCPLTYGGATFTQFGPDIRTWWTLIYTAPGTTFTLEILVVDRADPSVPLGQPVLHKDVWTWEVVATFESLEAVIHNLHQNTLGTTEVPCISGEEMASTLLASVAKIEAEINEDNEQQVEDGLATEETAPTILTANERVGGQNELFNFEALITSFCSFTSFFIPEECFSVLFPPSDDIQFGDFGFTGIIDSPENPCCCKLLADIDYIGQRYGITSR